MENVNDDEKSLITLRFLTTSKVWVMLLLVCL